MSQIVVQPSKPAKTEKDVAADQRDTWKDVKRPYPPNMYEAFQIDPGSDPAVTRCERDRLSATALSISSLGGTNLNIRALNYDANQQIIDQAARLRSVAKDIQLNRSGLNIETLTPSVGRNLTSNSNPVAIDRSSASVVQAQLDAAQNTLGTAALQLGWPGRGDGIDANKIKELQITLAQQRLELASKQRESKTLAA